MTNSNGNELPVQFFKSILKIDSKNANPVIYLRGIQHYEMESINAVYLSGRGKIL